MNEKHILVFGARATEVAELASRFPNGRGVGRIDELTSILLDDHVDTLLIASVVAPELRLAIRNLMISHGIDIDVIEQEKGEDLASALMRRFMSD